MTLLKDLPVTPEMIVATARSWCGAPFQWGAAVRAGCDCCGLILGVARELGLTTYKSPRYGRYFDTRDLLHGLSQVCRRTELFVQPPDALPFWLKEGDVLLFTIKRRPQHPAIYAGKGRMIHADYHHGVVEHELGDAWLRRLWAVYEFRGVE
jgi:cell wall-associated NlpC family hydrolase